MNLYRAFTITTYTNGNLGLFFRKHYYTLDLNIFPEGLRRGCRAENFTGLEHYHYIYNRQQLSSKDIYEALQEI